MKLATFPERHGLAHRKVGRVFGWLRARDGLLLSGGFPIGIPRKFRLHRRSDFLRLRQEGGRWVHPVLILNAAPNDLNQVRLAVVVSRRVAKKAVHRNKIKRRLREILRNWIPYLRPGWDIVVIARSQAAQADFHTLKRVLWELLTQADLWQEKPPLPKENAPRPPRDESTNTLRTPT